MYPHPLPTHVNAGPVTQDVMPIIARRRVSDSTFLQPSPCRAHVNAHATLSDVTGKGGGKGPSDEILKCANVHRWWCYTFLHISCTFYAHFSTFFAHLSTFSVLFCTFSAPLCTFSALFCTTLHIFYTTLHFPAPLCTFSAPLCTFSALFCTSLHFSAHCKPPLSPF